MSRHMKSKHEAKAAVPARPSRAVSHAHAAAAPRRRRRWVWVVPLVIVCVLGVVYLGGVYAFNLYFMPQTTLDGADVSLQPKSAVASQKSASLGGYTVAIKGDGVDVEVKGSDVGLAYDGAAYADEAIAQANPWTWPLSLVRAQSLSVDQAFSFDRGKLAALLEPTIDKSKSDAQAAGGSAVSYDASTHTYALDEDFVAQYLNTDAVADAYEKAVASSATELDLDGSFLSGAENLLTCADTANSYVSAVLDLTLGGTHAADVTQDQIASWIQIADDYSVGLDTQAIADWCHGELTQKLDTKGTERSYTRPDGKQVTVSDGEAKFGTSVYGWVINGDECAAQIASAIQAGQPATVELPCYQSAAKVAAGGQDWPDRYIDVDIAEQHARFYDGGQLIWEADVTTGQPSKGYDTPTGVWQVTNKMDGDVNLKGPINAQTQEPEWDSHVNFWVGVVQSIVGFHNAPWQEKMGFGKNIYTWYGSHGCIRMSYASAEALFAQAKVGDVVVIHN